MIALRKFIRFLFSTKKRDEYAKEKELTRIFKDHAATVILIRALVEIKNSSIGDNTTATRARQALKDWDKARG